MFTKIRLVLALLAVIGLGISHTYVYFKGKEDKADEQAAETLKGVKQRDANEQEIIGLPDPDLDERLSRWMRD
jgi:hypothetical protein